MKALTNILTVDVEDWYMDTDISRWTKFEDRIVASTDRLLDILVDTKATFFVLGYLLQRIKMERLYSVFLNYIHSRRH